MSGAPSQLAANDLHVGTVVAERELVMDARTFAGFAALTGDAHPIHYDEAYARAQGLRAPIAHGLLIVAMTALGATDLSARLHDAMVAMTGTQARFLAPVFLGDAVRLVFKVGSVEPVARERSLVGFDVEVRPADAFAQEKLLAQVRLVFLLRSSLQS